MITIVDYGTSNLGSMRNMLKKIGATSMIASSPEAIMGASKLIIPGVGAFDAGMRKLNATGMVDALREKALVQKIPVLGVCLGMQLMTEGSEEGALSGLGWVPAKTVRFDQKANPDLRVPHMGWNFVHPRKESDLITSMEDDSRFYFAHSFYVSLENPEDMLLEAEYGAYKFTAAFKRDNLLGAQFHPEKSHRFGMWLLRNFVEHF